MRPLAPQALVPQDAPTVPGDAAQSSGCQSLDPLVNALRLAAQKEAEHSLADQVARR